MDGRGCKGGNYGILRDTKIGKQAFKGGYAEPVYTPSEKTGFGQCGKDCAGQLERAGIQRRRGGGGTGCGEILQRNAAGGSEAGGNMGIDGGVRGMDDLKPCPFCGMEKWLKEIAIQLQIRNILEAKDWRYYKDCLISSENELYRRMDDAAD